MVVPFLPTVCSGTVRANLNERRANVKKMDSSSVLMICSGKFVELNKVAKRDGRCLEMESRTGKQRSYCSR